MSANPSSSGGSGGVGGSGGSGGGPCGACKFLRRKCVAGCIFAPYFDSEQGAAHFAAVHKVFGASNVSKLLHHIPTHRRLDAVVTICYEAQARLRDPVYGCVAHIFALQQQVVNLQAELTYLQAHLASLELPTPSPPPPPPLVPPPPLSIADLPSAIAVPATYDLSSLYDPSAQQHHPSWPIFMHQHPGPLGGPVHPFGPSRWPAHEAGGELHAVARELLHRDGSPRDCHVSCTEASPSSSMSK